jgi:hypothetical protein
MLASALSHRDMNVGHTRSGAAAWTDGSTIFVDGAAGFETQLKELCVQCALLAAGSLDADVIKRLVRRPELTKRYLTIEGHRALAALEDVLPPFMQPVIDRTVASRTNSPSASLELALSRANVAAPPRIFGSIQARSLLASPPPAEKPGCDWPGRSAPGTEETPGRAGRGRETG